MTSKTPELSIFQLRHRQGQRVTRPAVSLRGGSETGPGRRRKSSLTLTSKSPLPVQSFKILRFIRFIRRFGWSSYTSVVVINVWLCRLTGYVLKRRKK